MAPSMINREPGSWWPTPAASQGGAGEFIENLVTKDGEPAKPGERAYNPKTGKHSQITLQRAVKMWPTPRQRDYKDTGNPENWAKRDFGDKTLRMAVAEGEPTVGSLNPEWVEWLMGFPIGHTDLNHSGMQSSHKSSQKLDE
tara:strand:- start:771 stop:1196 length:426 start_codon:yes stop_codon:yes gene_type:complete